MKVDHFTTPLKKKLYLNPTSVSSGSANVNSLWKIQLVLTYWVKRIYVSNLIIFGSEYGLSPGQRQAIILTIAGILLIWPLGVNFSEILIKIQIFSLKKKVFENVFFEMASILSRPQCVNETQQSLSMHFCLIIQLYNYHSITTTFTTANTTVAIHHWVRDKMDALSQTTFSNAFSWMKMFKFWLKFHLSLSIWVQLTIF